MKRLTTDDTPDLDKPTGIPSMYGLSIELVDPNGPMPRPVPEAK